MRARSSGTARRAGTCALTLVLGSGALATPVAFGAGPVTSTPGPAGPVAAGPGERAAAATARVVSRRQQARRAVVTRLIVTYRPGATRRAGEDVAGESAVRAVDLRPGSPVAAGARTVRLSRPLGLADAAEAARQLAADPRVASAEPDLPMTAALAPPQGAVAASVTAPGDPMLSSQWPLTGAYGIRASAAWAKSRGHGVRVAVLDTGITAHPDLTGQTLPGYDVIADPAVAGDGNGRDANPADTGDWDGTSRSSWHGTHVAGTVAAATGNGIGIAGVAPLARVQPVRVLGRGGGSTSDIAAGIYWAAGLAVPGLPRNATPARVINMSLGGFAPFGCPAAYQKAIDAAVGRGVTVVVAAGNAAEDARLYAPANCANVVAVAASDHQGYLASYSNDGPAVDLAAPGGDQSWYGTAASGVLSTLNTGTTVPASATYAYYEGTSMAAPHVAGAAALLLSRLPAMTPSQVEARLRATARPSGRCPSTQCGAGILDASALVPAVPAPAGASATRGNASAAVSWAAPAGTPASLVTGYTVAVVAAVGTVPVRSVAVAPGARSLVVGGLRNATAYRFRVRAVTREGGAAWSAYTAAVTPAASLPLAPLIRTATSGVAGDTLGVTATAAWAAATGGPRVSGYEVTALRLHSDGAVAARTVSPVRPAAARSLRMTLSPGSYRFEVRALGAAGKGSPSGRSALVAAR